MASKWTGTSIKAGLDVGCHLRQEEERPPLNPRSRSGTSDPGRTQRPLTPMHLESPARYHCRSTQMLMRTPRKSDVSVVSLARRSVAGSMVLLKNDNNFLPLNKSSQIKMSLGRALAIESALHINRCSVTCCRSQRSHSGPWAPQSATIYALAASGNRTGKATSRRAADCVRYLYAFE